MTSDVARRLVALRDLQAADAPLEIGNARHGSNALREVTREYHSYVTLRVKQVHLANCRSVRVFHPEARPAAFTVPAMHATLGAEVAGGTVVTLGATCDCGAARVVDVRVI